VRGCYYANYNITAIATAQTMMQLTATASICVEILSAFCSQTTNTTNFEAEAYLQRASVAGATPTALTPGKEEVGDQAAASTVGVQTGAGGGSMAEPTYTANTKFGMLGWASLAGWAFTPIPEERPVVPPSGIVGIRLNTVPASSTFDTECRFREIG
jgi:hypothetical protein